MPSRFAEAFAAGVLRTVLSKDQARAELGDLHEELARRVESGPPRRWPGAWLVWQACVCAITAMRAFSPRFARGWRHILRDAVRGLRAQPAITGFAIVILTLSIGAATVTFSVVDHVVLRPLPFPDARDLVVVRGRTATSTTTLGPTEHLQLARNAASLRALAVYRPDVPRQVTFSTGVDELVVVAASGRFFETLAVPPILGRTFDQLNDVPGQDNVAVISHELWVRRFNRSATAVGAQIRIDDRSFAILGVMPPGFSFPLSGRAGIDLWRPLVIPPSELQNAGGIGRYLNVIARLAPGVRVSDAGGEVQRLLGGSSAWRPEVIALDELLTGHVRKWMLLVLAAVGLVVVIACVNVANLLLTRALARVREASIRTSLGASRRQLLAAQLVESLIMSGLATCLALLLAHFTLDYVRTLLPPQIARAQDLSIDVRVLVAAAAAAGVTALLFGLIPAIHASRADVSSLLKDAAASGSRQRRRWRSALLVAEVGCVVLLLVSSTLFVVSFVRVSSVPLGFVRQNLISIPAAAISVSTEEAMRMLRAVPGVTSAAALSGGSPPLLAASGLGGGRATTRLLPGDAPEDAEAVEAELRRVSPEYFEVAGVPLISGRTFEPGETYGKTIILDALTARQLFGETDAVGRTVRFGGDRNRMTVVGVAAAVRLDGPERDLRSHAYFPPARGSTVQFILRTEIPSASVMPALAPTIDQIFPAPFRPVPVALDDAFRRLTDDRRFNAILMTTFGFFALAIGAAGVYSVITAAVAQQTREIGIRMAVGATAAGITAWVLRGAGRQLAIGIGIGLFASFLCSRLFEGLLFGVTPTDKVVYLTVALVIAAAGLAAALVPARRAARIDPVVALRN